MVGSFKKPVLEVQVKFPDDGDARAVQFEESPLQDQLHRICSCNGIAFDEDENFKVLVMHCPLAGSTGRVVLGDARDFDVLPRRSTYYISDGREVAQTQLSHVEAAAAIDADAKQLKAVLGVLLHSVRQNPRFAEEVVLESGLQILLDVVLQAVLPSGSEGAELAALCAAELLHYDEGRRWCDECSDYVFRKEMFAALLLHMMEEKSRGCWSLLLLLFLTHAGPTLRCLHEVALEDRGHYLRALFEACGSEENDWLFGAAGAVLKAIEDVIHEFRSELPQVAAGMKNELRRAAEACQASDLLQEDDPLPIAVLQPLLEDVLSTACEASQAIFERDAFAEANRILLREKAGEEQLKQRNGRLEGELRRLNVAMSKMLVFVDVGEHPIAKSLQEIVHMGFDSIKWEAGYTALHYAAEHIDDARIVELLCSLAVDVSAKDDKGKSAADYARERGLEDNVKSINKFRKQVSSSELSTGSTSSTMLLEQGDEELFKAARQCRGFLHKYPTSGKHFWRIRGTEKRYFAVTRRHRSWELGYWESMEAFSDRLEPKGSIRMQDVTGIPDMADDTTVGEADVQICYREDANDKKLLAVAREEGFRELPSAEDAEKWRQSLRHFLDLLKRAPIPTAAPKRKALAPPSSEAKARAAQLLEAFVGENQAASPVLDVASFLGESPAFPTPAPTARPRLQSRAEPSVRSRKSMHGPRKSLYSRPHRNSADMPVEEDADSNETDEATETAAPETPAAAAREMYRIGSFADDAALQRKWSIFDLFEGPWHLMRTRSRSSGQTQSFNSVEENRPPEPEALPGGRDAAPTLESLCDFLGEDDPAGPVYRPAGLASGKEDSLGTEERGGGPSSSSRGADAPQAEGDTAAGPESHAPAHASVIMEIHVAGTAPSTEGALVSQPKDIPGDQADVQSSDSPAESPPKTGAKGPPKKGGKAGKGPPLPGTAGELYAVPDAAASAVPGEASTEILVSPPSSEAKAGPTPKGPFAKKGKGPGKGPPEADASTASSAPEDQAAAEGAKAAGPPGKKGGKGPPLPGHKAAGAPAETAERQSTPSADEPNPSPKTKGPGKKGGKGPPLPGGKAPAAAESSKDAPPTTESSAKGKGPPPPGGKGPSKGPGKGPAGKGKGKGKEPLQLRQPKIKPKQNMKQLWWSRFLFGKHLKEGEGIWNETDKEKVQLGAQVIHLMENRFGRGAGSVAKEAPKPAASDAPKEAPKAIRIITDPNLIVGKEAAVRSLPPAEEVAAALLKLDAVVLSPSHLNVIKEHASPQPAQVSQLEECRKEHPTVPFALPEEYMWHISRIPAYQARISCWTFVLSYKETTGACSAMLGEFQLIEEAIHHSRALRQLLALILQVGNYLNGGTDRGQADGFDLETLAKLDGVKDNVSPSKDVRHLIFELFFCGAAELGELVSEEAQQCHDRAAQLVEDLAPLLKKVSRAVQRDSEGTMKLSKNVRVGLEDAEDGVKELTQQLAQQQEALQAALQCTDDPVDPLKLFMAAELRSAKAEIGALEKQAAHCRERYTTLLKYFNHSGMKSSDFMLLWDNLLIPEDIVLAFPLSLLKKHIMPRFCSPQAVPGLNDLLVLWGLREPDKKPVVRRAQRARPIRRRMPSAKSAEISAVVRAKYAASQWRLRVKPSGSDEAS